MRIRKRKVPLPFSSLSPLPLSDPCFALFPPPVQHLLANSSSPSADFLPPDHPIDLDALPSAPISPALNLKQAACDIDREKIMISSRDGEGRRNDFREKGLVGAHVVARSLAASSSSSSFLDAEQDDQKEGNGNNTTTSGSISKRGRGGQLMEGSRCSRVNGRGWRCCQPTLVGYSLCEHHLGKGRLRSMTTVRVGATQKKEKQRPASILVHHHHHHNADQMPINGDQDEVEGFIITKPPRRRSSATKLGMVKARSISSLLDETTETKPADLDVPILSEDGKQEKY